jgi:hypothetical protein
MQLQFTSVHDYGRQFTDVNVWRRAVEQVCQRHHLLAQTIEAGLAGTHPVFLIRNDQPYDAANPTLTLAALALRLADRLRAVVGEL